MWTPCKTKKEREEKIKSLLLLNDKAVLRSVVAIYRRQTETEKMTFHTREENNIGFNAFDSGILSSFATQILEYGRLSPKQMAIARKKMVRYRRQLAEIAEIHEAQQGKKCESSLI